MNLKLENKKNVIMKTSNDNIMKIWNIEEEQQLIEEINKLLNINKICENHKRTIGGIKARLKKIIDGKNKDKIKNISEVIKTYFTSDTEKYDINKKLMTNIHDKLLGYDTIDEIKEEFKITELEIKSILFKLLKKETNVLYKSKLNKLINSSIIDIILNCNSINDIIIKNDYLKVEDVYNILNNILRSDILDIIKRERIKILIKKYDEIEYDNIIENNKENKKNKENEESEENTINNEILIVLKELKSEINNIKLNIDIIKNDIKNAKKLNKN